MKIIKLVKCARLKKKADRAFPKYVLGVVKKSSHRKNVLEKLGTFDVGVGLVSLNTFRLIFWLSKEVGITGNGLKILSEIGVISLRK